MSTLAEQAEARKEKLLALRRRKAEASEPSASNGDSSTRRRPTEFRFRNYDPASSAPRRHGPEDNEETVEKAVEGLVEKARLEDEARRAAELDLTNIQPKRPNWDLKRDLDKKLARLEPATQAAIAVLIRKRLQADGGAGGVGAGGEELVGQMRMAGSGPGGEGGLPGDEDDSDDE